MNKIPPNVEAADPSRNFQLAGPSEGLGQAYELFENPLFKLAVFQAATAGHVEAEIPESWKPLVSNMAGTLRSILSAEYESERVLAKRLGIQIKTLQNSRWNGVGIPFCKPFGPGTRPVRYHRLETDAYIYLQSRAERLQRKDGSRRD